MRILTMILALLGVAAAQESKRDEILAMIDLPTQAQALRNKGVDKREVKEALRAARGRKLKAKEARDLLAESGKAVDEHGRIDNFGAFVKGKLESGLRGRELAAAIRAEHQARGKGKGKGKAKGQAKGKSDDAKKEREREMEKEREREKEKEREREKEKVKDKEKEKEKGGQGQGKGRGKGRGR
jgi:hypothetical protein